MIHHYPLSTTEQIGWNEIAQLRNKFVSPLSFHPLFLQSQLMTQNWGIVGWGGGDMDSLHFLYKFWRDRHNSWVSIIRIFTHYFIICPSLFEIYKKFTQTKCTTNPLHFIV